MKVQYREGEGLDLVVLLFNISPGSPSSLGLQTSLFSLGWGVGFYILLLPLPVQSDFLCHPLAAKGGHTAYLDTARSGQKVAPKRETRTGHLTEMHGSWHLFGSVRLLLI